MSYTMQAEPSNKVHRTKYNTNDGKGKTQATRQIKPMQIPRPKTLSPFGIKTPKRKKSEASVPRLNRPPPTPR